MKRVVVIDDDYISSELVRELLCGRDCLIEIENNGYFGIENIRNNPNPTVVILDLNLPGVDGFEVFTELRKLNSKLPIIAYTAISDMKMIDRCTEMGFDDILIKPITPSSFEKVISIHLQ
ncbi:MAG: response regulator [Bacteroidales bacterium]|nr:response regulator [Bacteroidales bacterium]